MPFIEYTAFLLVFAFDIFVKNNSKCDAAHLGSQHLGSRGRFDFMILYHRHSYFKLTVYIFPFKEKNRSQNTGRVFQKEEVTYCVLDGRIKKKKSKGCMFSLMGKEQTISLVNDLCVLNIWRK